MKARARSGTVAIAGSGLAGPLLAILLHSRGIKVELYERRPDMRTTRTDVGRSINLALSARGIYALRKAGLWQSMQDITVPMKGRMIHSITGDLAFQPYGKDESEVIYSISRAELNIALMNAVEERSIKIHFKERVTGVNASGTRLSLHNQVDGDEHSVEAEAVIATDGANSAIRMEMLKSNRFDFSQQYLNYGYKELTIPAGQQGNYQLEKNALHIWPRGLFMLIALPNTDGSFACILFLPYSGEPGFTSIDSTEMLISFFAGNFPDAFALMPDLLQDFHDNPVGSMVTIKCFPWAQGNTLLLGDAAHAMVPFFGQGLNCAFEDCTELMKMLDKDGDDWPATFSNFQSERKPETDAIADMALENFIEMRDRVADPRFLLRKQVELALEARYPGTFIPKYSMVSFHRVPYSVALARGQIQDRILAVLCSTIDSVAEIDWRMADKLIKEELPSLEFNHG